MNKTQKIVFIIMLAIITVLAGGNGFLYARSLSLEKKLTENDSSKKVSNASTNSAASTAKDATSTTSTTTPSSTTTSPAPLGNRPSSPTDTVVIAQGETLFSIGQTVGVSWTILADVNGIEADKIKAGQTLIVPKNGQVAYTINIDKAKTLQTNVDAGKDIFRLSAVETAKSDSPTIYGLTATDTYTQTSIDATAGTAIVTATKNSKNYTINLKQPATIGAKGIWAIESIKVAK